MELAYVGIAYRSGVKFPQYVGLSLGLCSDGFVGDI
jgi:hypothetical protein